MSLRRTAPLRILCATDFSTTSLQSFHHALALALTRPSELTLLHVGPESRGAVRWDRFPSVRATLVRWGRLDAEAPKPALADQLGIHVHKVAMRDRQPALGILDRLARHPTDLVVMGTTSEQRAGWRRNRPVAIEVLREARCNTLLLPRGCRSLLDERSGRVRLHRLLLAVDHHPDPRDAVKRVGEWLPPLGEGKLQATTLHVGGDDAPRLALPRHPGLAWDSRQRPGSPAPTILAQARELDADLVVMPSATRPGWRNRLRRSTLEQVHRQLQRALLVIPEPHHDAEED